MSKGHVVRKEAWPFVTLDGRVEMLDDWSDPQAQDEELSAELMRQSANEDVLLSRSP